MKKKVLWIGAAAILAGLLMGCISISMVPQKPADASGTGSVSFSNIPGEYNGMPGSAWVGNTVTTAGLVVNGYEIDGSAAINGGALSIPLWAPVKEAEETTGWAPFTENAVKDVLLRIDAGNKSSVVRLSGWVDVLFKSVQFTNGKASLDFNQGVKQ